MSAGSHPSNVDSIPEVPGASKAHLDVGRGAAQEVARGVSSARDLFYFIFYPLALLENTWPNHRDTTHQDANM